MRAIAPSVHSPQQGTIKSILKQSRFMSNRDGFTSGLMVGGVLGGLVGGILGVVLASRLSKDNSLAQQSGLAPNSKKPNPLESENIEIARLSLEDKIAQLNQAIDDVRQQLDTVNGNSALERPLPEDG